MVAYAAFSDRVDQKSIQNLRTSRASRGASGRHLRLDDRHASVLLVGPLAVVVLPGALRFALEAAHVLLFDDAAVVVERHASVLLCARVVLHRGAALLVLNNGWVRAARARVLRRGLRGECENAEQGNRNGLHLPGWGARSDSGAAESYPIGEQGANA